MFESLSAFAEWLSGTAVSTLIQNVSWIIPSVQSIHLLAIAVVMSSVVVIFLRVIGLVMRERSLVEVTHRFMPWIWYALIVLLITGTILIVGEPTRSLTNWMFQLKMLLLLIVVACSVILQWPLRNNATFWDSTTLTRASGKVIALISLALWMSIVFAGRWIAYAGDAI